MSVDAKPKPKQAPAFAHRWPVRGELVPAGADRCSATSASRHSKQSGDRDRRSGAGVVEGETKIWRENALQLRGRTAESP